MKEKTMSSGDRRLSSSYVIGLVMCELAVWGSKQKAKRGSPDGYSPFT